MAGQTLDVSADTPGFSMRSFHLGGDDRSYARLRSTVRHDELLRSMVDHGSLGTKITQASVEYFSSQVTAFRRMDDVEGGSKEGLKRIEVSIRQVATILDKEDFVNEKILHKIVDVLAQLCQIAGWMAYDSELHGLAQRYFRSGLHAAQDVSDRNLGAHILACMAYQAAHRNLLREAAELATAATRAAKGAHPLVRTIAAARMAHTHAAVGDNYGFRSAIAKAADLFEEAKKVDSGPDYLYWFDSTMAQTVEGQGVLLLTLRTSHGAKSQLDEAERLLASETSPSSDVRPRDASFHGAWLARAHVKRGDLDRGLRAAETALDHMAEVSSPRTRRVLHDLDHDLANLRQGSKLPEVRALRQQLQPALSAQ